MADSTPKKASWDQRLTGRLAQESWKAANDPSRRRRPPFWAQIRSPYYWFGLMAYGVAVAIWLVARPHWIHTFSAVLYVMGLLMSVQAHRHARVIEARRSTAAADSM